MSFAVRELWNPWTTALLAPEAVDPTSSSHATQTPVPGAAPLLFAAAWERDATGVVQRVALAPERRSGIAFG
jgi:hypothetical protein